MSMQDPESLWGFEKLLYNHRRAWDRYPGPFNTASNIMPSSAFGGHSGHLMSRARYCPGRVRTAEEHSVRWWVASVELSRVHVPLRGPLPRD